MQDPGRSFKIFSIGNIFHNAESLEKHAYSSHAKKECNNFVEIFREVSRMLRKLDCFFLQRKDISFEKSYI